MMAHSMTSFMKTKVWMFNQHPFECQTNWSFVLFNLDPDVQVRCSIPGTLYLISSIALVLITKYLQNNT